MVPGNTDVAREPLNLTGGLELLQSCCVLRRAEHCGLSAGQGYREWLCTLGRDDETLCATNKDLKAIAYSCGPAGQSDLWNRAMSWEIGSPPMYA